MDPVKPPTLSTALFTVSLLMMLDARANGVLRNGAGARAMSLGGASVAQPDEPLEAISVNPAGLGLVTKPTLQVGAWGAFADGHFSNAANAATTSPGSLGVAPEAALAFPLESAPVVLGFGVAPDVAAGLDWQFVDAPGGLTGTTSYGTQRHFAELVAIRTAAAASLTLGNSLSLGASLGVTYNRNSLQAPYIFQSHPTLRGFKTLLDLQTEGWGLNGTAGAVYRPHESVSLGLSYRTSTHLESTGTAAGNAGNQLQDLGGNLAGVRPDFRYHARVVTALPQTISTGLSWQFHRCARAILQIDWINWGDSFDHLDIHLTRGNNADLNAFLESDQIDDVVPLHWRDRFVYRAGFEFAATDSFFLRGGYAFGDSPVPDETLTPMSAAILEHTLTAGVEWRRGRWSLALAYQYDFPAESRVGVSSLRSGEYSHSRTQFHAHWFGVTTSVVF